MQTSSLRAAAILASLLLAVSVNAHVGVHRVGGATAITKPAEGSLTEVNALLLSELGALMNELPPLASGAKSLPQVELYGASVSPVMVKSAATSLEDYVVRINLSRDVLAYGIGSGAFEQVLHAVNTRAFDALPESYGSVDIRIEIEGMPLSALYAFEAPLLNKASAPVLDSLPKTIAGKRVAISPGHGVTFYNGGWNWQRGLVQGVREDLINHDFVTYLDANLRLDGAITRPAREMNRSAGSGESGFPKWQEASRYYVKSLGVPENVWNSLSTGDDYDDDIRVRPLYANWQDANGNAADILVSLHNNAGGGTGTETWYDTANGQQTESKRLADLVHNRIISAIRAQYNPSWPDRRVKGAAGSYGENRVATRPAILIEVAFMDFATPDNAAMQDDRFRQIVAAAVAAGVRDYFVGSADTGNPTTPTGFKAQVVSSSQIDLSWEPSTDNVGVTGYRVLRNGVEIAQPTSTTYSDTTLNASTRYEYSVAARDAVGNWSAPTPSIAVTTAAPPAPYMGLWWVASESGWGMSLTQHGDIIFAAMYTYDATGAPNWYVISNCTLNRTATCSGDIYRVVGGKPPTQPWDVNGRTVTRAGSGTLSFASADAAIFSFTIDGTASSKAITRQPIKPNAPKPSVDYTDLWWNANESGWGISLTQEADVIFAAWFTYETNGAPVWYVASNCTIIGSSCTGLLYRVTGGSPLTMPWAGGNRTVGEVGNIALAFTSANAGTLSYTLNGVAGSRAITRQPF